MAQFSLSWNKYQQNICNGLSSLQQNGEFVDMTLAADGHHVKVHQLVMSLISPYIKELISSAQCPHPVIFLNRVSYPVLCSILEYIYTGEVLVARDHLEDLIEAAKELHIRGLEDMTIELTTQDNLTVQNEDQPLVSPEAVDSQDFSTADNQVSQFDKHLTDNEKDADEDMQDCNVESTNEPSFSDLEVSLKGHNSKSSKVTRKNDQMRPETRLQYSISTQGSLQLILNRYVYYLRYTSRHGAGGEAGHRMWRCMEYVRRNRCPGSLITKDEVVVRRYGMHNHPFHDKQILKKVRDNILFGAIGQAETEATYLQETKKALKQAKKDT